MSGDRTSPDPAELEAYHALQAYTLTHGDPAFIHQHVVDAWAAQHADRHTKPITLVFALAGLYLYLEQGMTGRHVQRIHMRMAQRTRTWPALVIPQARGTMTARDVMAHPPGPERDRAIQQWCAAVWQSHHANRATIIDLLKSNAIL